MLKVWTIRKMGGGRRSTVDGRLSPAGFTLIELLMVVLIIGILATVALPALKGFGQSNVMKSATQQLIDDVQLARLMAMNNRSTVHLVFVPEDVGTTGAEELYNGVYTSYAIFSERSAGDQPDRPYSRYRTEWRHLPDGVFIPPYKFFPYSLTNIYFRGFQEVQVPFPGSKDALHWVPAITFNSRGQLVSETLGPGVFDDVVIPLARGSVWYEMDASGEYTGNVESVQEIPPGNSSDEGMANRIRVEWLTGRARVERKELE